MDFFMQKIIFVCGNTGLQDGTSSTGALQVFFKLVFGCLFDSNNDEVAEDKGYVVTKVLSSGTSHSAIDVHFDGKNFLWFSFINLYLIIIPK